MHLLSQSSISEYLLYGTHTKNKYKLSRIGIRFNTTSEKKPYFNKWIVFENAGSGNGRVLLNTGEWISIHQYRVYENREDPKYYFESAELALDTIITCVSEELTPYPQSCLLSKILEDHGFTDDFNSVIQQNTDFVVWNEGEYSDIELEITVTDEAEQSNRISMNLHMVFNWEDQCIYIDLGTNLGDGFNEGIHIPIETSQKLSHQFSSTLSHSSELKEYIANLKEYTDEETILSAIKEMADQLDKLEDILRKKNKVG